MIKSILTKINKICREAKAEIDDPKNYRRRVVFTEEQLWPFKLEIYKEKYLQNKRENNAKKM